MPLLLKLGVSVENELELSTYARKQKAQRWLQVDGEMQIAKSRHSKIFSARSGIEMSMMRRQIEIVLCHQPEPIKKSLLSAAVTSTAPKLPAVTSLARKL